MQIISPDKFGIPNNTLNELILVISVEKMFVYNKYLNEVQMALIGNYTLPAKRCMYYFYSLINETAATLTSNC